MTHTLSFSEFFFLKLVCDVMTIRDNRPQGHKHHTRHQSAHSKASATISFRRQVCLQVCKFWGNSQIYFSIDQHATGIIFHVRLPLSSLLHETVCKVHQIVLLFAPSEAEFYTLIFGLVSQVFIFPLLSLFWRLTLNFKTEIEFYFSPSGCKVITLKIYFVIASVQEQQRKHENGNITQFGQTLDEKASLQF